MDKDELAMTGVPNPCPFTMYQKHFLEVFQHYFKECGTKEWGINFWETLQT